MKEIEKLKLKLVEEEKEFVKKEKKLMKELSKFEVIFILHLSIILEDSVRETGMLLHVILIMWM